MKWFDILRLSQSAIRGNRLRSNLTIAIIAVGIMALISILTVIEVLKWNIYNNLSGMGANTFTIMSQRKMNKKKSGGSDPAQVISLQQAMNFKERFRFPALISISSLAENGALVKHGSRKTSPNVMVMATDENYLKVSGTNMLAGRNFSVREISSNANICLLGYAVAKKIFTNVAIAENAIVQVGSQQYRVLGVMESKGASLINRMDNMVLIPIMNGSKNYGLSGQSCVLSVLTDGLKNIDFAMGEAEGLMRSIRKLAAGKAINFVINKNDELANTLVSNIQYVTLSASVIGFITLLGAAIGLMNIMLVSVAERTREIGLSKSVGATNAIILRQFLTEAILISLTGGVLGIVSGILTGNLLSLAFGSPMVIPWIWILTGLAICVAVGLTAGIYPALKASRLNPIESLRYE
ncbi:MAG: ABC transporter permease [Chitinophagaceae bacterium]|nr:ABC transporter permease [Chitinophagaceae bacterium]